MVYDAQMNGSTLDILASLDLLWIRAGKQTSISFLLLTFNAGNQTYNQL